MDEQYPTRAYDLLNDLEREAVDEYVRFIVEEQKKNKQRVALALNKPIPSEFIRRSRHALSKPVVKAAVAERILEEAQTDDISPDRVIKELSTIAFSDVTDFLQPGHFGEVTLKDLQEIPADKAGAIKSIETKPGVHGLTSKVTMHDKLPALKALSEFMGITAPERPPVLQEYVRQEIRHISDKELQSPESEYVALLEHVVKKEG